MEASMSAGKDAQWKSNDGNQTIDFELYAVSIKTQIGIGGIFIPPPGGDTGTNITCGIINFTAWYKEKGSKTPDYPKV